MLVLYNFLLPQSVLLTILAGFPATTEKSGTSFVTTLPAPTMAPFPIVTSFRMMALKPIQASSPMCTGFETTSE